MDVDNGLILSTLYFKGKGERGCAKVRKNQNII
jgi:hypothetical protein